MRVVAHACAPRGRGALERLAGGDWQPASVVTGLFGTRATARSAGESPGSAPS